MADGKRGRKKRAPLQVLTDQHKMFCAEYLRTSNAVQSYIKAFPDERREYKCSAAQATALLKEPIVQEYYRKISQAHENANIAKAEEVLAYFTRVMRGEEKDQFGLDASLSDRNKAAEALGKRYGLFTDKLEVKGSLDIATRLKEARARARERRGDD